MYLHGTFKKQDLEEKASPHLPPPVQTHATWAEKGEVKIQLSSRHSSPSLRQSDSKDDKHLLDLDTGCSKSEPQGRSQKNVPPQEPEKFKVAQDNW